jgi:multiple sugar transport system substrate-binding protein/sorbitol/mannitol transport system substrate-binding protein
MNKRILVGLLLLFPLVMSFAAGGKAASSSGSGRPYEGVTINLLADNRPEFDKMLQLYPEFEARTGIKLNFTQLQETPLRAKTGLELAAPSTDIDVIMMDFTFVAKYSAANYLEAMDDYLAKIPSYKQTDFMQSFLDGCSYQGKLYAVPINQDCSILMYRADIFKELNLNVPKTFEDLEDVCRKIKAAHPEMSAIAMRGARGGGVNEWTWPSFLWGFGGQYYDFNTYKATLNSPAAVQALDYYARILKNYGPVGVANYSYMEVQTDLMQGNTAMIIDSASLAPRCEDPVNSKVAGKLGYDVVPGLPGKAQPGFYAWTLAVPRNSRNKAAAAEFVAWLASPEIGPKVGWSAPNQALQQVYSTPAYRDYSQSKGLYNVMIESLAIANPDFRPRINEGSEISTRVSEAISSVLAGETNARAAMDAANTDVEKILRDAGYQK